MSHQALRGQLPYSEPGQATPVMPSPHSRTPKRSGGGPPSGVAKSALGVARSDGIDRSFWPPSLEDGAALQAAKATSNRPIVIRIRGEIVESARVRPALKSPRRGKSDGTF